MSDANQYDIPIPEQKDLTSEGNLELSALGLTDEAKRKVNNVIEDNIEPIAKLLASFTKGMMWILTLASWAIAAAIALGVLARIGHLFLPNGILWLTADRIKEIDSIFIGVMAGLLTRVSQFMKKFIPESKNKKDH